MKQSIKVTPQDVTRISSIGDALAAGWAKVPVFYHYAMQVQLPMTDAEFEALFVKNVRLFLADIQQTCPGIQTNVDIGGAGFNEPFLLLGIGVIAMGEGLSFAQDGEVWPIADIETFQTDPVAPRIFACVREESGTERFPSKLWYGGPTWRLIEKFFQMKRFILRVGRCEIVNENLFELGMIHTPPSFQGASSSNIPTMCFVRETNDVMIAKKIAFGFLPVNTSVVESATGPGGSLVYSNASCAPNAGVTYGHPVIHNLANRIFCLPQPLLVTPDTRVDLEFQTIDNDCCLLPAARRAATLCCETPFYPWPATTVEETSAASCSVPGGCLTLGIILKGYICLPKAVADYLINYLTCGSAYEQLYANNSYMAGIVRKFGLENQPSLKGLIGSLKLPPA
jgi:hypothetical protein